MPARFLPLALTLLVLSPVVAACGGENRLSGNEYRAKLAALDRREAKAHVDVEQALNAKSVDEIRTRLTRFADDQQRLGDDVAKLKPPKDAEAANAQLARGAHDLAKEIRVTVTKLSGVKKPRDALDLLNRSLGSAKGAQEVDAALTELKKKGYG